jgi:hypothetical protein
MAAGMLVHIHTAAAGPESHACHQQQHYQSDDSFTFHNPTSLTPFHHKYCFPLCKKITPFPTRPKQRSKAPAVVCKEVCHKSFSSHNPLRWGRYRKKVYICILLETTI